MFLKSVLRQESIGLRLLCVVFLVVVSSSLIAQAARRNPGDTLPFPIHERKGDIISDNKKSTYDFKSPVNMTDSIVYDFKTRLYTVYEKIGDKYYRTPTTYTFEEYWALRGRQAEVDYFKKRANTMNLLNRKLIRPKLSLYDNLFNRLFGNGKIEISPQGNVDITAGYQGQNIKNPTLPERARKNGGFDFDMNAQVNVNANIGDKLKFPINYNTLANFDMENQLKLDYTGVDDEIIKRIEAGNSSISFAKYIHTRCPAIVWDKNTIAIW